MLYFNSFNLNVLPDYSQGFGGKFGVQKDRVDKSAVGWEHVEKTDKHASQKGNCCALACVHVHSKSLQFCFFSCDFKSLT